MLRRLIKDESGMTMGLTIIMIVLIGVLGAGFLTFVVTDLKAVVEVNQGQKAFEMADAGVQAARVQLNADLDPRRYDGEDTDVADSPWAESKGGMNLDMNGDRANVRIQANPSTGLFTVISTGEAGDARRRVEAVYEATNGVSIPPAYFTRSNMTVEGSANLEGVSLFALGNVTVEDGASLGTGPDEYFGKWAETGDEFSYPNPFNSTPRPSELAGIGALGTIDVRGDSGSAASTVGENERSFDSTTDPIKFVSDFSSDGNPGQQGTEITSPFDTAANPEDVEILRRKAMILEAASGPPSYDYYREEVSGSRTISRWPADSDYDTVVFYSFEEYSDANVVTYDVAESCASPSNKGVIVVENGNFIMSDDSGFDGAVIVRGGEPVAADEGTYTSTEVSCLTGYASSTGDMTIGGTHEAGSAPALGDIPALKTGMELRSWRELYE